MVPDILEVPMIGPILGSVCLGVVLGWLVRYFLERFRTFNARVFSTVASVLCGGVIAKLLPDAYGYWAWFYPVGLLIGIIVYPIWEKFEQALKTDRQSVQRSGKAPPNTH